MENSIHGIILKVPYDKMGNTADIEILGKTMLQWVSLALPKKEYASVDYNESVSLPILLRPYLDRDCEYTAVLFSDTPLITKSTVLSAISQLEQSGHNVLKMTRGYVFKTAFLAGAEKIYTDQTHYFDEEDFVTAFSFKQVSLIGDILKNRIITHHMEQGVQFEDVSSTYVGCDVAIASGVVIGPNNIIKGETVLKSGVKLVANNIIENSVIDQNVQINSSQIYKSFIGANTTVGPYAYIRPDTVIGANCRIGDFVEIKKSIIGEGCKISHLSYVGDCEMGTNCNVGCGVVFVNYDGKNKFKAKVGNNVFIGSNVNLIAPINIEDGAFLAAGSTINKNVKKDALAIARARQEVKENWQGNNFTKKI